MPSDAAFKAMNRVHRIALRLTRGRLGRSFFKMPVVELTTVGRKSGEPRTVLLTSPLSEGDTIVVVASRGGDDRHPAWLLNVRENPDVEVRVQDGPPRRMLARVASPEERARLWPKVTADHKNYAGYQRKTDREIPLVLLDPAQP